MAHPGSPRGIIFWKGWFASFTIFDSTPQKTNMTMEKLACGDVSHEKKLGDFPTTHVSFLEGTWRITPLSKWLVIGVKPFTTRLTLLRGLTITMVTNHLQVMGWSSKNGWTHHPKRWRTNLTNVPTNPGFLPGGSFMNPLDLFPHPGCGLIVANEGLGWDSWSSKLRFACLMLGKSDPKIFFQMVVVHGDESHGIESVEKSPTKQIQENVVCHPGGGEPASWVGKKIQGM